MVRRRLNVMWSLSSTLQRWSPVLDVKPSNMLTHIRDLAGDESKEAFERAVLLNRLPEQVRTTLASSSAATIDDLVKEADKVMESYLLARSHAPALASVDVPAPAVVADHPDLPEVDAVTFSRKPFLCFVHERYGPRAYSCRSAKCTMRNQVQKKPSGAPGNSRAGR